MLTRLEQSANAESPMLVTVSDITTRFNDEHRAKAPFPILIMLAGIETLVSDTQSEKA